MRRSVRNAATRPICCQTIKDCCNLSAIFVTECNLNSEWRSYNRLWVSLTLDNQAEFREWNHRPMPIHVAGPAARGVQDSDARPSFLLWSCPGIPCRWLSACHRRSSKATAFCWHEDTVCPPKLQLLRGQDLCSCGHKFAGWLTKRRVAILPVQTVAEDVFISTVRPRKYSYLRQR